MNPTRTRPAYCAQIICAYAMSLIFILLSACSSIPAAPPTPSFSAIPSPLPPPETVVPATRPPSEAPKVLIPAGEFMMGTESGESDEKPAHKVYLDAFYIDVYEVTNALYAECVAAGACTPPRFKSSQTRVKYYDNPEFANYPVIYLLWDQARAFCHWRGGELPSEAQWEKAARGALEGMTYAWGDELTRSEANYCDASCSNGIADYSYDDGFPDTSPVGSFAPNGYGLYDMAGNVWDITLDWYSDSYYSDSPLENPAGPENGQMKVARGGSWYYSVDALRVTYREEGDPQWAYSDCGIRCVYAP